MENNELIGISQISARIKELRAALEKTQRQMAAWCGVTLPAWQLYESGKNIPGGKVLANLCARGVNINWLLTGQGNMMRHFNFAPDSLVPPAEEPSINGETLRQILQTVEEVLEKAGASLPPMKKASLIEHLLDEAQATHGNLPPHTRVEALLRLAL